MVKADKHGVMHFYKYGPHILECFKKNIPFDLQLAAVIYEFVPGCPLMKLENNKVYYLKEEERKIWMEDGS